MSAPPDLEPGFWNEYVPPASHVAAAIQYPTHDPKWADRVVGAYVKDAAEARRAALKALREATQ